MVPEEWDALITFEQANLALGASWLKVLETW
jgi:hypothetical protein